MANDTIVEGAIPTASVKHRATGGRLRRWLAVLLVAAVGLLLVELLLLGVVKGWMDTAPSGDSAWTGGPRDTLIALVSTATPTPSPTPTPLPAEIAAQFVPQLEDALTGGSWDRALELVAIMQAVDPSGEPVRNWAVKSHMQYGQALVKAGQEAQAQVQFDQAVELAPADPKALLWQGTTQLYLAGREALITSNWDAAIEAFTRAHKNMPDYSDLPSRLVESYRRKGQAAIEAQDWPVAVEALVQALDRAPKDLEVINLLSAAYRGQGQTAMVKQDWTAAIKVLTQAHERLPRDQKVVDLLATAYRKRGITRQEAAELKNARSDLEAALALRPGDTEAQTHLDRVKYLLSKRIEIDISKQRMYVWKGDKLVYNWPVSTGLRGRDTATGHFRVLDKIPMAYSKIWRLKMPYWLGVYYVQGIENGIHALPIRPDGSVMWGGLLGQRASYGCIILSNQAARTLYKWVDIGTQVDIHH